MKEKDFFLNKLGTPMVRKQQYPKGTNTQKVPGMVRLHFWSTYASYIPISGD